MRAAREYERRCKELQEEREKYRKQLETEMKKTENGIAEGLHHFDEMLTQVRKALTRVLDVKFLWRPLRIICNFL